LAIWQRSKENPIERAEHRSGGAEPQRQHQHGSQREARILAQRPKRNADNAYRFCEESDRVHAVNILTHLSGVADVSARRHSRVCWSHTLSDVFLGLHTNVKLEFFIDALAPFPPPQ